MLRSNALRVLACLGGLALNSAIAKEECAQQAPASTVIACKGTEIARLDRSIGEAFEAARRRLGEAARSHLARDQEAFRQVRTQGAPLGDFDLELTMALRRDFLNSVQAAGHETWGRHWGNHHGTLAVAKDAKGRLEVRASAIEPAIGRWSCEFDDQADAAGERLIVGQASARLDLGGPNEGWTLSLKRKGDVLVVEEAGPAGASRRPFCTGGGSLAGVYFALGEPEVPRKDASLGQSRAR